MKTIKRFLSEEEGLETVEYAVIAGLIVVGLVATVILLRTEIINTFNKIITTLQSV